MKNCTLQLLAREAGFVVGHSPTLPQPWITGFGATDTNIATMLARFAELVVEREHAKCILAYEEAATDDQKEPSRKFIEALRNRLDANRHQSSNTYMRVGGRNTSTVGCPSCHGGAHGRLRETTRPFSQR